MSTLENHDMTNITFEEWHEKRLGEYGNSTHDKKDSMSSLARMREYLLAGGVKPSATRFTETRCV